MFMDMMTKISQALKLLLIATLLIITPLLSTSLRTTYLSFIVHLLIIALISFSKSPNHKKLPSATNITTSHEQETVPNNKNLSVMTNNITDFNKAVEKCVSEKTVDVVMQEVGVKKCPSTPSLFFIGGGEEINEMEGVVIKEEKGEEKEEVIKGEISKEELFYKAETFIGNFYKQLKMQREDSWKRLYDFYHKTAC
ncbi:uncharacterized protein [Nicotiana tomentosiformis]|uniref:uncharacterized protein n=1 Tax=Nicotiana tomentosiformis TaxID=4098 RepID=UPI00144763E2|nr:uncharacterized protein LOC117278387 [Nicotiana tomentosiformis]